MYTKEFIINLIETNEMCGLGLVDHRDLIKEVKNEFYPEDEILLLEFDNYTVLDKNLKVLNSLNEEEIDEVGIWGI